MLRPALPLAAGLAALLLASCATVSTREVNFDRHPIGLRVLNTVVDEYEGTTEYTLMFRNNGREIVSFDYTVSDRPAVPHVDQHGPNSGIIENLYPGEEREVKNPVKDMSVHVTLGTVTYGKKAKDELAAIYDAQAFEARKQAAAGFSPTLFPGEAADPYAPDIPAD